tara:strand:+ start:1027 stop:1377 length:351 start_codon:yes stop_codon:yes gene_type:complete
MSNSSEELFSQNNMLLLILLAGILIYMMCSNSKESFNSGSGLRNCYKMDTNMCSPDCCGKQWPVSFNLKRDPRIKKGELGSKYIPTNMSCTGKRGSGCVCADRKQYKFLTHRGNNA